MARIEEETIAEGIRRILGIELNELRVEQIDEISTTHCSSGVT